MAPDRSLCRFPSPDKPTPSPSPPNATTFAGTEYDTIMDTTTIQSPPRPHLPLDTAQALEVVLLGSGVAGHLSSVVSVEIDHTPRG